MIFIILVVVILAFVALWNIDLHKIVYVKALSQNGGDSAALAAARWQAITLNLVGDLNIMQAVALTTGDTNQAKAIGELQARLCYVGPMIGLEAAQQAAKNNGLFNNDAFTEHLLEHADTVLNQYAAVDANGNMMFPEPYTNAWKEYAAMISAVAMNGVAAGPDNARYYSDVTGGHILLAPDFYDAVAGQDWCWFFHHAYALLLNYKDYHDWPPLPAVLPEPDPENCEFYGLGLKRRDLVWNGGALPALDQARVDRGISPVAIDYSVGSITSAWYCYDTSVWGKWDAISPFGAAQFPAAGPVKSEYDYSGADAAARVVAAASRLTPMPPANSSLSAWGKNPGGYAPSSSRITWTAAAKPLGYLETGGGAVAPNTYGLVIPAFHDVRLIPLDASSEPAGGAFDLEWREHVEKHLEDYMATGQTVPGCWYCQQLAVWENPVFRQTGIDWLKLNSGSCQDNGGPGGPGGGAKHGH